MAARIWAMVLVALSRSSAVAGGMRGGQVARWRRARWAKRAMDKGGMQQCPKGGVVALVLGGVVQRLRVAGPKGVVVLAVMVRWRRLGFQRAGVPTKFLEPRLPEVVLVVALVVVVLEMLEVVLVVVVVVVVAIRLRASFVLSESW